ncbi:uncharacterized protein F5147DRAFT_672269, partial [Suillus discolor]
PSDTDLSWNENGILEMVYISTIGHKSLGLCLAGWVIGWLNVRGDLRKSVLVFLIFLRCASGVGWSALGKTK